MKSIIIFLFIMANMLFASDELVEIGRYSMPNTEIRSVRIWQNAVYLRTESHILKFNIDNPQIPRLVDSINLNYLWYHNAGYYENYIFLTSGTTLLKYDLETMSVCDSIAFNYLIEECRWVVNDSFLVVPTVPHGVYIYNIKHSLTTTPTYYYKSKGINPEFAIFKNNYLAYTEDRYYGIAQYNNNEFSNGELKYFSDLRPSQAHRLKAYSDFFITTDYKNDIVNYLSDTLMLKQVYYDTDKGERKCYLNGSIIFSTVEYKNKIIATTDSSLFVIGINANNNLEVVSKYPARRSLLAANDKYLFAVGNGLRILSFNNTDNVEETIEEPIKELIVKNGVIHLNQESNEIIIFDINGLELEHLHNTSNIDVNNLHHGVYFIKIDEKKYKINI